jgi:hypothetical protein
MIPPFGVYRLDEIAVIPNEREGSQIIQDSR